MSSRRGEQITVGGGQKQAFTAQPKEKGHSEMEWPRRKSWNFRAAEPDFRAPDSAEIRMRLVLPVGRSEEAREAQSAGAEEAVPAEGPGSASWHLLP